jgi:hypothetical protein
MIPLTILSLDTDETVRNLSIEFSVALLRLVACLFMFLLILNSSVSSDSIVKGIIDDIIKTAVKTAEVDEQKTKYLQHFINKNDTIVSN